MDDFELAEHRLQSTMECSGPPREQVTAVTKKVKLRAIRNNRRKTGMRRKKNSKHASTTNNFFNGNATFEVLKKNSKKY